jgi:endothelin-converting enzyme/putative endopeptidase
MRLALWLPIIAAGLWGQSISRSGIHPEDMDPTCKPCNDFWRYVNGGWLDKNPIPAHLSSWGPFSMLNEANQERTRTILEAAASDRSSKRSANQKRMGDLYASCMDTAAVDKRGLAPLEPDLNRIAAIQSVKDLNATLAAFQLSGRPFGETNGAVVGGFRLTTGQDPKNPSRVIVRIVERDAAGRTGTSIFSLPDRDYYVKTDPKSQETRAAFVSHVARMLELAGAGQASAISQAEQVLAFETALAEPVMTLAEKRDPEKTYHLMDLKGLTALAPNVDWPVFFRALGLPESSPVNVTEPELLKKVSGQIASVPLETWKTWMRWRSLALAAPYLAAPFSEESFRFNRTVLAGVKEQSARWQTCATVVDRDLSDALGEAYAAKYFPPEAKLRMSQLVENLRAAMREELEQSEWMEPATKKSALAKLDALEVQIGYPGRWKDYSAIDFDRGKYFENVRAAWTFGQHYELARAGKPVSHVDWAMTTPTVNAYSNASETKVVFPAGILQPPFFDMQADDAANYGAIGSVIGHEIGHQFDDGGSKYDATGALRNWWTDADKAKFEARTACVVDQFNTLDVGEGLRHNGKQVLGEALGDLGGVATTYRAWKKSLEGKPAPPVMDGFTAEQRFFISFARVWGTQFRPEALRLQLNTNNHPVSQYRAIGTLQNMPEFHKAFQCKAGDPMVRPPQLQCKLW